MTKFGRWYIGSVAEQRGDVSAVHATVSLASSRVKKARTSLRADIKVGPGVLSGYFEADFLNRPPEQPYRVRQFFGRYTIGNWEFSISCGAVQFCRSRLVAVEKYHAA